MGFNSTNVIQNLGLVFIFICAFLLAITMTGLLGLIARINCRYQYKVRLWHHRIARRIYWNFFIRFFIEVYLDLAFVNALRLRNYDWMPASDGVSTVLASVITAIMIVFPIVSYYLLIKNQNELDEPEMKEKYHEVYENVRTSSKTALGYTSVFMAKRFGYAFVVMMVERRLYETFLIIHLLMLGAAYTLMAKPFTSKSSNYQETFNDIFVLLLSYSLIIFDDQVVDKKA